MRLSCKKSTVPWPDFAIFLWFDISREKFSIEKFFKIMQESNTCCCRPKFWAIHHAQSENDGKNHEWYQIANKNQFLLVTSERIEQSTHMKQKNLLLIHSIRMFTSSFQTSLFMFTPTLLVTSSSSSDDHLNHQFVDITEESATKSELNAQEWRGTRDVSVPFKSNKIFLMEKSMVEMGKSLFFC